MENDTRTGGPRFTDSALLPPVPPPCSSVSRYGGSPGSALSSDNGKLSATHSSGCWLDGLALPVAAASASA